MAQNFCYDFSAHYLELNTLFGIFYRGIYPISKGFSISTSTGREGRGNYLWVVKNYQFFFVILFGENPPYQVE